MLSCPNLNPKSIQCASSVMHVLYIVHVCLHTMQSIFSIRRYLLFSLTHDQGWSQDFMKEFTNAHEVYTQFLSHNIMSKPCSYTYMDSTFWYKIMLCTYDYTHLQLHLYNWLLVFQDYCCGAATCCKDDLLNDLEPGTIEGPSVLFDSSKFIPLDPSQELIFPPALKVYYKSFTLWFDLSCNNV